MDIGGFIDIMGQVLTFIRFINGCFSARILIKAVGFLYDKSKMFRELIRQMA